MQEFAQALHLRMKAWGGDGGRIRRPVVRAMGGKRAEVLKLVVIARKATQGGAPTRAEGSNC